MNTFLTFIFAPTLFLICFYTIDIRYRSYLVFLFGILLLFYLDVITLISIFVCSIICKLSTYIKYRNRLWFFIVLLIGLLIFFKIFPVYIKIFITNALFLNTYLSITSTLPLGISFVIFRSVSFCIDYSNNLITYKPSFFNIFSYLIFFPTLFSGPIILARDFVISISTITLDTVIFFNSIKRILWGLFKKIVIADNIAGFNHSLLSISEFNATLKLSLGFLYMIQLYADFSGYSDIAIGVGSLIGYKVPENFNFPFTSTNVQEFWRRWHISLMIWFKEYVYIPLGGSIRGKSIQCRNILIVFLLSGVWHGWGINFILWGGLNAVIYILYIAFKDFFAKYPDLKLIDLYLPSITTNVLLFLLMTSVWLTFFYEDLPKIVSDLYFNGIDNLITIFSNYKLLLYIQTNGWITLFLTILFLILDNTRIIKDKFVYSTNSSNVGIADLILIDFFLISLLFFGGLSNQQFSYFNF